MKMIVQLLPVVFAGALCFACKSDANKTTGAEAAVPPAETAPPPSLKPEVYLYVVTVDNLLLRDQPTQTGSKVITKFKLGDFVQGSGENSDKREEANIRGIPIKAPFIKVTSTTPEEHSGWAFGGALQPVYAGPRATSPDLGRLTQLSTFLKGLDLKEMESGGKAWAYVRSNFGNAKGTLADAAFILLENFLHRLEVENEYFYGMLEKVSWTDEDQTAVYSGNFDTGKYPQTQRVAQNGFRLQAAEGSIFAAEDWRELEKFFAPLVTPPMKSYLGQVRAEQDEAAFDDGGIVITLEKLTDRAVFWEKFNRDHRYFVLSDETRLSQDWTLEALMNGANNTPVFDYENGLLSEDFKKAWDYAQRQYPDTEVGKSAKMMGALIAADGNKKSKRVEEYQASFRHDPESE